MLYKERIANTFRRYDLQNCGEPMSLLRRETGRNRTLARLQGSKKERLQKGRLEDLKGTAAITGRTEIQGDR